MSNKPYIVIGLGLTGISVARYLVQQGRVVHVCDTREAPANLSEFQQKFPEVKVHCGSLDAGLLATAVQLIVSPGIAIETPAIAAAAKAGVEIIGDIELFARVARTPIVAITGSNGKSTVATLLAAMAKTAGLQVGLGGNIGTPALDLLGKDYDVVILELSSFQLETTASLQAEAVVVLNVCEDHLDRYPNYAAYISAKQRLYAQTKLAVVNLDDANSWQNAKLPAQVVGFSLEGVTNEAVQTVYSPNSLAPLVTSHYFPYQLANFLAAFALGKAIELPEDAMLATMEAFPGLPHRCQTVLRAKGVTWINDSKATNVGSAISAISSVGQNSGGKIILIAGGEGKEADFSVLTQPMRTYCKAIILLGKDSAQLAAIAPLQVQTYCMEAMTAAVALAKSLSCPGDVVLLSPACASLDMYKNYQARGDHFMAEVKRLNVTKGS